MKINPLEAIRNLDGEQLKSPSDEPITVRTVCCDALLGTYQDEQNLSGEEKLQRYELAKKIHSDNEVILSAEEIVLAKKVVAKAWNPLVMGQAWKILDS